MRISKVGKRMKLEHQTLLAAVVCHCKRPRDLGQHLWLKGKDGAPHGLEFLITRVIQ